MTRFLLHRGGFAPMSMHVNVRWASGIVLLAAIGAMQPTHAGTAAERALRTATAPHIEMAGKPEVRVHWVARIETIGDDAFERERMDVLHAMRKSCHKKNKETNAPIAEIKEWPDKVGQSRTDTYLSDHAIITYSRHLSYIVNAINCSLSEAVAREALVETALGLCRFDLDERTWDGNCFEKRDAPPFKERYVRPETLMPTADSAVVLGQPCEWVDNPIMPGLRHCYAMHPRMPGFGAGKKRTILALRAQSKDQINFDALAVEMERQVPAAIFAPHRAWPRSKGAP